MSGSVESRAPSIVEVEFELTSPSYPFLYASAEEDCRFELAHITPRGGERYAEFFNVRGAEPERILEIAREEERLDAYLLNNHETGALFEFVVWDDCPAFFLTQQGALPREVIGDNGEGRVVAEIPDPHDPSEVIEEFLEVYQEAELTAKRKKDQATPMFTISGFKQVLHTHLTKRQREVLHTAFAEGYYDWPRTATGEEVAEELDISSATFSEHINSAERKILEILFRGPAKY